MFFAARLTTALLFAILGTAAPVINIEVADPGKFRVTTFASGAGFVHSMQKAADGSVLALSSTGFGAGSSGKILRFVDADNNGIADGPGQVVYSSSGALTGLVKVGDLYAVGNQQLKTITLLQPGAGPGDSLTPVGSVKLTYAAGWWHDNIGMAARPTPGQSGSFDLIFNVGSQFDKQQSIASVSASGLFNGTLDAQSLYSVTLDLTGAQPTVVANSLKKVAANTRNVVGMGFQPGTGDFYFADNGMNEAAIGDPDPIQADELNLIAAADFGITTPSFGFPTCYTQYRTGAQVGTGCVTPLAAFQPIPTSSTTQKSEGAVEIAFAPGAFASGFNNGVFVSFYGNFLSGPANTENALVYYDIGTGKYVHFVKSGLPGMATPTGLLSTSNSLFLSDAGTGAIYQISAVPEPSTVALFVLGLCGVFVGRKRMTGNMPGPALQ
jgi:glucose/arabinose dehydrogenase